MDNHVLLDDDELKTLISATYDLWERSKGRRADKVLSLYTRLENISTERMVQARLGGTQ